MLQQPLFSLATPPAKRSLADPLGQRAASAASPAAPISIAQSQPQPPQPKSQPATPQHQQQQQQQQQPPQQQQHKQMAPQCPMRPIKLRNLLTGDQAVDTLNFKYKGNNQSHGCNETYCLGAMMNAKPVEQKVRSASETLEHARDFIDNFYASIKRSDSPAHKNRLAEIEEQLRTSETYYLKETELTFGAKLAWRNASRCIGRIQWSKLQVFDARFTSTANEMFEALCNHIKYATNKGSLRSAITILPQRVKSTKNDWRIWNSQLVGYAGYRDQQSGKVVGDPANVDITEICQRLGWKGKGGRFDVLPLVLQANGSAPQVFPLPEDLVLKVKIRHPKFKWFEELELEWYALPAVANMMLDVGGLQFTAAPFSGWYMVTEIGTRDLGDSTRYNVLEEVAHRMGLNTTSNATLWKDQALVELNVAVLDSFQQAGVTIVDHHTASETFMTHLANEQRLRGGCPADWVWVVPPTSGSTMQVFHQEMVNYHLLPNYEYQDPVWKSFDWVGWERQQQAKREELDQRAAAKRISFLSSPGAAQLASSGAPVGSPVSQQSGAAGPVSGAAAAVLTMSPSGRVLNGTNGEMTPRKLRFKEIARAVKFTSKLFGKALSRRIKATILYATETGKSERFANKLAQTFSSAFNVHLMSMSDYDMTCLEHEALLLVVTSTFGNGDPPENGEMFAKHLAAVKITGETSPDIDSINSVSSNPFFQMLSEDHKDDELSGQRSASSGASSGNYLSEGRRDEHETHIKPLSNVRFSVFALGSTAYPHFCAYGRYVDQTLGELGAERILRCSCGDELCGQEKAFNEWSNEVFKIACDVFCLTDSIGPIDDRPETQWSPSDVRFVPVELIGATDELESPTSRDKNNNLAGPVKVTLSSPGSRSSTGQLSSHKTVIRNLMSVTNKRIIAFTVKNRTDLHEFIPGEDLQTLCIDLQSDQVTGMQSKSTTNQLLMQQPRQHQLLKQQAPVSGKVAFEAGDHVAIYPVNKLEMVDKIVARMRGDLDEAAKVTGGQRAKAFDFDQTYTILVKRETMDLTPAAPVAGASPSALGADDNWITHDRLPVTTMREALTRYLDITSPPNQEFLLILSRQASDPDERKRLQLMARNFTVYEEWKNKKVPQLVSLLAEFSSIKFEPALVTQIPLMKPRFYSVSGTAVSLTLGVVRYKTSVGELREGLCSNYLSRVPIDPPAYVYGYIRSAPAFHMPQDKSIPMILISAGTGIAPFRSFWQKRYADICSANLPATNAPTAAPALTSTNRSPVITSTSSISISSSPSPIPLVTTTESLSSGPKASMFGRIDMYFGCRNSNYILYKDELDKMYDKGVLSSVNIAFSRPTDRDVIEPPTREADKPTNGLGNSFPAGSTGRTSTQASTRTKVSKIADIRQLRKKVYVQDKLLEDGEDIARLIMLGGAHIYVCGDVAMADGVYKTLASLLNNSIKANKCDSAASSVAELDSGIGTSTAWPSIVNETSKLPGDDGETLMMNLRNLNRYHEDIFGAKQAT